MVNTEVEFTEDGISGRESIILKNQFKDPRSKTEADEKELSDIWNKKAENFDKFWKIKKKYLTDLQNSLLIQLHDTHALKTRNNLQIKLEETIADIQELSEKKEEKALVRRNTFADDFFALIKIA